MVAILILTILFILALPPLFFIPLVLCRIHRICVILAAKIFQRGKLLHILHDMSTLFDAGPTFTRKAMTIVTILEVNSSRFDIEKLRKNFEFKREFPKLDFTNPENLSKLYNYASHGRVWQKDSPLWEFLLVENVDTPRGGGRTFLIWRCAHVLCDGRSVFKLVRKLFDDAIDTLPVPTTVERKNSGGSSLSKVSKFLRLPYAIVEYVVNVEFDNTRVPQQYFHLEKDSCDIFSMTTNSLSMADLKRIKNAYRVDFITLLLAGVAAGIRDAYLKRGLKIDTHIKVAFILPAKNHRDVLMNHLTTGAILLPIGEEDSVKRLLLIRNRVAAFRSSGIPEILNWYYNLLGSLPLPILKKLIQYQPEATVMVNNIFGHEEKLYLHGDEVNVPFTGVNIAVAENSGYAYDVRFYPYDGAGYLGVSGFDEYFSNVDDTSKYLDNCISEWNNLSNLVFASSKETSMESMQIKCM
ncbi:putative diacylglycerol O-acyltransferase tgs1 [Folsomia candida]|uniref:Putative diacylglycerol O-acyltransferase tgs1 n=1 Tax=Folsomia candida TaxID=158441 RepID=A0A226DH78_FOLCA|nr:putative diacylglycerol O-acyltransferase tgs1 [Folsomia candida]